MWNRGDAAAPAIPPPLPDDDDAPMSQAPAPSNPTRSIPVIARLLFLSRWLQLPLYVGLIVALGVYVVHFWAELIDLVLAATGNVEALQHLLQGTAMHGVEAAGAAVTRLNETTIMLVALSLIDVVMIANLLIMVIVGGYETFVSRMRLERHPDKPEWLSHVDSGLLKVKLAMAIIGISSISLLRTFVEVRSMGMPGITITSNGVMWQTIIHSIFILSAIGIAFVDRYSSAPKPGHSNGVANPPVH